MRTTRCSWRGESGEGGVTDEDEEAGEHQSDGQHHGLGPRLGLGFDLSEISTAHAGCHGTQRVSDLGSVASERHRCVEFDKLADTESITKLAEQLPWRLTAGLSR